MNCHRIANLINALTTCLAIVSVLFLANVASAGNTPLACQDDEVAGLKWDKGRWVVTRFTSARFILVHDGATLTLESVKKAFGSIGFFECTGTDEISCSDHLGYYLYYNVNNMKGGMSRIYGATNGGAKKDTISVAAFTCQPF